MEVKSDAPSVAQETVSMVLGWTRRQTQQCHECLDNRSLLFHDSLELFDVPIAVVVLVFWGRGTN
jgi:hypothetical protein